MGLDLFFDLISQSQPPWAEQGKCKQHTNSGRQNNLFIPECCSWSWFQIFCMKAFAETTFPGIHNFINQIFDYFRVFGFAGCLQDILCRFANLNIGFDPSISVCMKLHFSRETFKVLPAILKWHVILARCCLKKTTAIFAKFVASLEFLARGHLKYRSDLLFQPKLSKLLNCPIWRLYVLQFHQFHFLPTQKMFSFEIEIWIFFLPKDWLRAGLDKEFFLWILPQTKP